MHKYRHNAAYKSVLSYCVQILYKETYSHTHTHVCTHKDTQIQQFVVTNYRVKL